MSERELTLTKALETAQGMEAAAKKRNSSRAPKRPYRRLHGPQALAVLATVVGGETTPLLNAALRKPYVTNATKRGTLQKPAARRETGRA